MSEIVTNKRLMPEEANRLLLQAVPVPPVAHAYHHWDEAARTLTYTYNNRRLLTIRIPGRGRVSFRHGSDGTLQGIPFVQQVYLMVAGGDVQATVQFQASADTLNLKPHRAGREQAILGQVGRPLLPGANGLYDVAQDLLVTWFGRPWEWRDATLTPDADGNLVATMQVTLGPKTWIVNIKPHYYRQHLGYRYHQPWRRRPNTRPVAGWCSWEAYRRDVSEGRVLEAADFFARHLRPYGLEYLQLDDGYEPMPFPRDPRKSLAESWQETRPDFPSGHTGLVRQIRARGFQAGVWNTACVYNDAWADANPGCLLQDAAGRPLIGDWVKYILDCSEATLDRQVRGIYRGFRAAGYTYFKIDGIRHLLYDGLQEAVLQGLLSNAEAEHRFRRFLEVGREELGPDSYWLSSWGVLTQMVGLCDACRIAQDARPDWSGMQMQLVESARWFFTHRILYTNDPDHVCVRAPLEWSRTVLSLVALSGGLYMLSDPLASYDGERLRIIQQTLPPLATVTAETGPLDTDYAAFSWTKLHGFAFAQDADKAAAEARVTPEEEAYHMAGAWTTAAAAHPFSTLWAFHLDAPAGRWCVAGRFASLPLAAAELAPTQLALAPDRDYLVFDFWAQRFLGRTRAAFAVPALPLGHCQVLALRAALPRPQLLSSSRHISQDAVSVQRQTWRENALTLELEGVCGTRETYWVHVPPGWRCARAAGVSVTAAAGAPHAARWGGADQALPVHVEFPAAAADRAGGTVALNFVES